MTSRGINAGLELIRRTRGGRWPTELVTEDFNYVDLVWHECEFRDGDSFTYCVRTFSVVQFPDGSQRRIWFLTLQNGVHRAYALRSIGQALIVEDPLAKADAIVVVAGGTPSREEAGARLYRDGLASALNNRRDIAVLAAVDDHDATLTRVLDSAPDVIIVDVHSAYQISTVIRRECPSIRIVAFAIEEDSEALIQCAEAGVRDHGPAPTDIQKQTASSVDAIDQGGPLRLHYALPRHQEQTSQGEDARTAVESRPALVGNRVPAGL